ncbi:MAG: ADP-ribosylglycohydrolase family protein [Phycisphaeraceae bacterium]|nr:ADP-ribosylglycohydrolase family protein [Phycisphaeraceae bacterium]
MAAITLDREMFCNKVTACWLGKSIGGTLGMPYEGRTYVQALTFYDPVPTEPLPNDDLDFQLVWLKMVEDKGRWPRLADFAEYWRKFLLKYPWNEYGFCRRNLELGLGPPMCGWFNNYYVDEMGSPIRSEIWACLAPGNPQFAASLAWMDSCMDHAGGEGMWGEMFWAAVQSAAFVVQEARTLIDIGLTMIPPGCATARVIREAMWCHRFGVDWGRARQRVHQIFGHMHAQHGPPNHGFTVLGWLYGKEFGDQLCKAVNAGYDTDCTGATLGALLGIQHGTRYIPQRWIEPIGRGIKLHEYTGDCDAPADIDALTERTVKLFERLSGSLPTPVSLGSGTRGPEPTGLSLWRHELVEECLSRDLRTAYALDGEVEIILHYGGEPVWRAGQSRRVAVTCEREGQVLTLNKARLSAGRGYEVRPCEGEPAGAFVVTAGDRAAGTHLDVEVEAGGQTCRASFVVLGEEHAEGFPAAAQSTWTGERIPSVF